MKRITVLTMLCCTFILLCACQVTGKKEKKTNEGHDDKTMLLCQDLVQTKMRFS